MAPGGLKAQAVLLALVSFFGTSWGATDGSAQAKPRLYVGVPMNWPIEKESTKINLRSLINSWGSKVDVLRFYVHEKQLALHHPADYGLEDIEPYLEPIPMKRSDRLVERNIWEKMWRGWLNTARKYLNEADWFMKADIDTFLVADNIKAFLSHLDHRKTHYLGHALLHEWDKFNLVFNSGVGYVLSWETLRRYGIRLSQGMEEVEVQAKKYQCYDRGGPLEDPNTGGCLRELGILAGDTLDSEGRQRFNLFRPRDLLFNMKYIPEDWYWKNKMSIGVKQLGAGCCSPFPLAWHNFKSGKGVFDKNAFFELDYIFGSQPYEARVKAFALDPPSGNLFQYRRDEISFKVDDDLNALLEKHGPDVKVGRWLKEHPDMKPCFETGSDCPCNIPEQLPQGFAGDCVPGSLLSHGQKCEVKCEEGYSEEVSTYDGHRGLPGPRHFQCVGGMLTYPRLACNKDCVIPNPPAHTNFIPAPGNTVKHKGKVEVKCFTDSYVVPHAECKNGRLFGRLQGCLGQCYQTTLVLHGERYTQPGWREVKIVGGENDKFKVIKVPTGSERDPIKNCQMFKHDHQLVIVKVEESGEEKVVFPLCCANQEVHITSRSVTKADCPNEFFT